MNYATLAGAVGGRPGGRPASTGANHHAHIRDLRDRIATIEAEKKHVERVLRMSSHPYASASRSATTTERKFLPLPKPQLRDLRKVASINRMATDLADALPSSSSSSEVSQTSGATATRRKKGKKLKSGLKIKADDDVITQVLGPDAFLQFQYVSSSPRYNELTFPLFVAGELEIISSNRVSIAESQAWLNLLRILAYEANRYSMEVIREWHRAFMHSIEMGWADWSQDPYTTGQAILCRSRPEEKSKSKKSGVSGQAVAPKKGISTVWFCAQYNRKKCQSTDPHEIMFKGKPVMASHICAACWLKNKVKANHPECSDDCPLISAAN